MIRGILKQPLVKLREHTFEGFSVGGGQVESRRLAGIVGTQRQ